MSPIEQEPKHVHYSWRLKVCDLGSCSEVGLGEVRHLDGLRCALAGPESSILLTSLLLSCDHFTASLLSGDLSKGRDSDEMWEEEFRQAGSAGEIFPVCRASRPRALSGDCTWRFAGEVVSAAELLSRVSNRPAHTRAFLGAAGKQERLSQH